MRREVNNFVTPHLLEVSMQNPDMVASVFGPFLAITGLWVIMSAKFIVKGWPSPKTSPGLFYIGGSLNLLFGLIILSQYNLWTWSAELFVTLLGWVLILRGILSLFIPELVTSTTAKHPGTLRVFGIITLSGV